MFLPFCVPHLYELRWKKMSPNLYSSAAPQIRGPALTIKII